MAEHAAPPPPPPPAHLSLASTPLHVPAAARTPTHTHAPPPGLPARLSNPPQDEGFSEAIIDRFFRPFLGGIFFDRGLGTTSRLFAFVMRMLATGARSVSCMAA